MALSKKLKSSLLVATLVAGGITIGVDKANSNKRIKELESSLSAKELKIDEQNKEIKKKERELTKVQKDLCDTETSLKDTKETLKDTEKSLKNTKKALEDTEKELKNTKGQLQEANRKINSSKVSSFARSVNTTSTNTNKVNSTNKKGTPVSMTLTFYGDGADENGGYAGITASGQKLRDGMVASNYYPFGTKFELNGKIYTVSDRGGSGFNGPNNLDVFVPRRAGESTVAYKVRIMKYGKRKVTMYKL